MCNHIDEQLIETPRDELFVSENLEENSSYMHKVTGNSHASRFLKPIATQEQRKPKSGCFPITKIPEKFWSIFPFQYFNIMQSESFHAIYNTNDNCVISSPTGSGKTVLFELSIIKILHQKSIPNQTNLYLNSKIIYMAPTKALCKERYDDWCTKFQPLNFTVGILTGDSSLFDADSIRKSDIIICTPEKWDGLTRRWTDYRKLFDLITLLLVDEIHFLRDKRGTSLEVVITRMMSMTSNLRIIALSATVPNIEDVSKWLKNPFNEAKLKETQTLIYDDTYRAVSLKKTVYGYKTAGTDNPYKFDMFLNGKVSEVIKLHSKEKPVLIFCPTRNSTINTARYLLKQMSFICTSSFSIPSEIGKDLRDMILAGIAYHHAGLSLIERKFVEDNFKKGNIKVLTSTTTLAVGVNLPAYLVIIKGTKIWKNNELEEYSELDLMQMMGRAGRPQFEKEGECVILTDYTKKDRYTRLIRGSEKLESSLIFNICEHIIAEVTLNTIRSLETAFIWLQSTFFFQRYLQNSTAYPVISTKTNSKQTLEVQIRIFLKNILDDLIRKKFIEVVGSEYVSTVYGKTVSKSYVLCTTVEKFINSKIKLNLHESLVLLSQSSEFDDMHVKLSERKLFRDINGSILMFRPIKSKNIELPSEKVSVLIQFELGGIEYPTYQGSMKLYHQFTSEKIKVFRSLIRIIKAAIEIYSYRKDSISLNSMLQLNRCIFAKSWENTPLVLKQIDGIGLAYAKRFSNNGIINIAKVKTLSRDKIEYYLGLKPGSGQRIARSIARIPELDLKVVNIVCKNNGDVEFDVKVDFLNKDSDILYAWNESFVHINVLTDVGGRLLDFRRMPLRKLQGGKQFKLKTTLEFKCDYIKVYFNCDEIAGIGKSVELDVSGAVRCLKDRDDKSTTNALLNSSESFEFDDEDEVNAQIFGESVNVNNKQPASLTTINENNATNKLSDISNISNTSMSSDPSFKECAHRCIDRKKCRHICCKEGIPQNKIKMCKHACKDKSKCRHLCCREQIEYEKKQQERIKSKALRQKTLDFTKYTGNSNVLRKDIEKDIHTFSAEMESGGNAEIAQGSNKKIINDTNLKPKIPIFLRRVDESSPLIEVSNSVGKNNIPQSITNIPKVKYKKLENSTYFSANLKNVLGSKKSKLLDISDSDEYSDSFDDAIDKALKIYKRKRSVPANSSVKKTKKIKKTNSFTDCKIASIGETKIENVIVPKSQTSSIKEIKKSVESVESVEDIVIADQISPQVFAQNHAVRIGSENNIDQMEGLCEAPETKQSRVLKYSDESIESCPVDDSTVMTSVIEVDKKDIDILSFLDSDVEIEIE